MLEQMKIGFLGGGKISEAILSGLVQSGGVLPGQIFVTDPDAERLRVLMEECGVNTVQNDAENNGARQLAQECSLLVLAIKPQMAEAVLPQLSMAVPKETIVVSVMGGVTLNTLEAIFADTSILRVMPNTPMSVRQGVAGIAAGQHATAEQVQMVQKMFSLVGATYVIPEKWMDSLTAISGCGPAFAYLFIEALADGGVKLGLPRDLALALASQTLVGAGTMQLQSGIHPGALKDSVTSPGGGTIAGVHALECGAFRGTVMQAVLESAKRMEELSKE